MDAPVVEARGLRKRFGERVALDGVDVAVNAGEVAGLLGPNGAGKTTTLSILAGTLAADAGSVRIAGHDLSESAALARLSLGVVPQSLALYPSLTAAENLTFFGRMHGLTKSQALAATARLLEEVGLADRAHDVVATFSGGMKRRLNVACGMPHRPALLLLDEPTAGVDPQSRELIFGVVERAAAAGAAIIYSTHYMEEAERLCARVILIDHGRVVADGPIAQLVTLAGAESRLELTTRVALQTGWARALAGVRELPAAAGNGACAVLAVQSIERVPEIIAMAGEAGGGIVEFHLHRPNLQDAFIVLTGHALRDMP